MNLIGLVVGLLAATGTTGGYNLPEPLREAELRRASRLIVVGIVASTREVGEPQLGKCWEWQLRRAVVVIESVAKGRTRAKTLAIGYRRGLRNLVKNCKSAHFPTQLTVGERYRLYLRLVGRRRLAHYEIVHWNGVVRIPTHKNKK